ncbi:hypothetical protein ACHAQH_006957 [Verticillium albo-atrum]
MATIKAIEAGTVHRIQSGQVIVDLSSVVKELVENSLDADATAIDVRFRNQGLESIEVQDNGSGISPDNYKNLALKHHTSKLATFSDLSTLSTFGFRGEALSSLCALSQFSVVTCLAGSSPKATKLEFEPSGKLKGTSMVAAQKGTVVTVNNLFHNLPVRRRELERNIKREWNKVIALLNQYACIQTGLKFTVSQQPSKGKRIVLFSTKGNPTTRDNIINIFGAKTTTVLISLNVALHFEPTAGPGLVSAQQSIQYSSLVHVRGFVSRPAHGEGRQTPDRQMFFVNGRPCVLPQFAKVFNDVYKSYNSTQSPFILADIQLDTHLYDVNVSPDKRTILMHEQSRLLESLREALTSLFESHDYSMPFSQITQSKPGPGVVLLSHSGSVKAAGPPEVISGSNNDGDPRCTEHGTEATCNVPSSSPSGSLTHRTQAITDQEVDIPGQALMSRWVARKSVTRVHEAPTGAGSVSSRSVRSPESHHQNSTSEPPSPTQGETIQGRPHRHVSGTGAIRKKPDLSENASRDPTDETSSDENPESANPKITPVSPRKALQTYLTPSDKGRRRMSPEVAIVAFGAQTGIKGGSCKAASQQEVGFSPLLGNTASADGDRSTNNASFGDRFSQAFSASPSHGFSMGDRQDNQCRQPADIRRNGKNPGAVGVASHVDYDRSGNDQAVSGDHSSMEADSSSIDGHDDAVSEVASLNDDDASHEAPRKPSREYQCSYESLPGDPDHTANPSTGPNWLFKRKDATLRYEQLVKTDKATIESWITSAASRVNRLHNGPVFTVAEGGLEADNAEEQLSLIISKADFGNMSIIGQFNLGFIIAARHASARDSGGDAAGHDSLFIIDQHASDEKYNFERLQSSTVVQSQHLVQPKQLELTALEEEIDHDQWDCDANLLLYR